MAYFLFSDHPESTFVESKLQFRAILLVSALIALLVSGFFQIGFPFLRVFVSFVKGICLLAQKLLFKFKSHRRNKQQRLPLPPGPAPWPIVGSLPEMWRNKPTFRWIHSLMEELNTNIACIRLGNVHVIPITSPEIALEVVKDKDSVFASRPVTMATEYSSCGFLTIAVVPRGEQWKKMRKVVTSDIMNSVRLQSLLAKRREEADNVVRFIYNQCKSSSIGSVVDVRLAARQYCGNIIRKMMFNRRYFGDGKEDGGPGYEEKAHVESLFTVLNHLYSFTLSDYIPWLRVFDAEGHEKVVSEAMRIISKYHDSVIDERVKQWRDGKKKEVEDLLDAFISSRNENGKPSLTVEEIKAQCTELMLATVDNPSNAVEWAIAEMLNRPELFKRATEEIDSVVGKDRLVQESDIPKLNFVKACLREAFRLHPIAPFNLPHLSTQDATIAGYFIPKGSHVLLSRLGLGRNPEVWEDPLKFKPERHMKNTAGPIELTEPALRLISFSRGRRGCMGVALGSEMATMLLARLLQGFDWGVPLNHGERIDLTESKYDLFLAKPLHAWAKPRLPAEIYPTNLLKNKNFVMTQNT
ncbi:Cytochrome P450 [Melia azedarach]|uniref:Cytochrome P450 n=1 Tax=Melia azedarach TaxID=155640 RepID=A0ACC1YAW0_MELAZ|nr:Cytochrome P450 [Melia azedarach]